MLLCNWHTHKSYRTTQTQHTNEWKDRVKLTEKKDVIKRIKTVANDDYIHTVTVHCGEPPVSQATQHSTVDSLVCGRAIHRRALPDATPHL